jgi:hypothetical protein
VEQRQRLGSHTLKTPFTHVLPSIDFFTDDSVYGRANVTALAQNASASGICVLERIENSFEIVVTCENVVNSVEFALNWGELFERVPCRMEIELNNGYSLAVESIDVTLGGNFTVGPLRLSGRIFQYTLECPQSVDTGPAFVACPLINFVPEVLSISGHVETTIVPSRQAELLTHPLLIRGSDPDSSTSNATEASNIAAIPFLWNGLKAHIQMIPDYPERFTKLRSGEFAALETAILVLPPSAIDLNQWKHNSALAPLSSLVSILTVATGSPVSLSWIASFNSSGKLVQFLEPAIRRQTFDGYIKTPAITSDVTGRIGLMLTQLSQSDHRNRWIIYRLVSRLVEASRDDNILDDKLSHLFKAFENLFHYFRLTNPASYKSVMTEEESKCVFR